jgi:hypothetical protein
LFTDHPSKNRFSLPTVMHHVGLWFQVHVINGQREPNEFLHLKFANYRLWNSKWFR